MCRLWKLASKYKGSGLLESLESCAKFVAKEIKAGKKCVLKWENSGLWLFIYLRNKELLIIKYNQNFLL